MAEHSIGAGEVAEATVALVQDGGQSECVSSAPGEKVEEDDEEEEQEEERKGEDKNVATAGKARRALKSSGSDSDQSMRMDGRRKSPRTPADHSDKRLERARAWLDRPTDLDAPPKTQGRKRDSLDMEEMPVARPLHRRRELQRQIDACVAKCLSLQDELNSVLVAEAKENIARRQRVLEEQLKLCVDDQNYEAVHLLQTKIRALERDAPAEVATDIEAAVQAEFDTAIDAAVQHTRQVYEARLQQFLEAEDYAGAAAFQELHAGAAGDAFA